MLSCHSETKSPVQWQNLFHNAPTTIEGSDHCWPQDRIPVECTPHGRGGDWASRSAGAADGFPVGVRFIVDLVDCVPGSVAADSSLGFLSIG